MKRFLLIIFLLFSSNMLASITVSGRADLSFAYTYDKNKNVIDETSTGSAMGSYSWKTVNTNNDDSQKTSR